MTKNQKKLIVQAVPKKKCKYCLSTDFLTYDHKVPIILGGKTVPSNIQVLCKRCNGTKSGLSNSAFLNLARFVFKINIERQAKGKRPLGINKKTYDNLHQLP